MFNEHPISEEEYIEFREFIREYNQNKRRKKEDSLLYWIYNKLKSVNNKK